MGWRCADVIYTDPPWNPTVFASFYAYAGGTQTTDFTAYLSNLARLLRNVCPRGTVAVDFGNPYFPAMVSALQEFDGATYHTIAGSYGAKMTPMSTWVGTFGRVNPAIDGLQPPAGLHGFRISDWVVGSLVTPKTRFYDPCAGALGFPILAIKAGTGVAFGSEIIPQKLATGLAKLARLGFNVSRCELPQTGLR